ncbi:saposin [Kipferlia bialata]|uniref:Saposin n=1 Tax=Kipferlia bialata TaxID=797122 RepID=A0A9K3CSX1_9EUKA|nr:saposin [Kipferlia bialata]|eukprot:g3825.t1
MRVFSLVLCLLAVLYSAAALLVVPGGVQGPSECAVCNLLVSQLDDFLDSNKTVDEIVEFLDSACSYLPSSLEQECDVLVEAYIPDIMDYLVANDLDPKDLCSFLGLCRSAPPATAKQGDWCSVCTIAMDLVDIGLESDWTLDELDTLLADICSWFPTELQPECHAMIGMYDTVIIAALVDDYSPDVVCEYIGLC